MSKLPGDKPERARNFHDRQGKHIFPHPRTYEPRKSAWTAWDRRYAEHLDRHKELAVNPEPMDSDPKIVMDLFAHIELLKSIIKKEQQLITALREKAAAGGEPDELEMRELTRVLREEGGRP